ncbi:MAG TPA: hypothetical protein PKD49_09785 [Hyphomicrobium sp.]|mgnify:CR=1 FL=1|nr:hypothetical protein [Hyphomicrobium sp.]
MGLLRLSLIVAAGVALLPADSEQQEMLYNRAVLATHWTMTFCDRNEATCQQAGALWGTFKKKAQFAAELAYDAISEQIASSNGAPGAEGRTIEPVLYSGQPSGRRIETGTLKPHDLEPDWRGGEQSFHAKTTGRLTVRGGT